MSSYAPGEKTVPFDEVRPLVIQGKFPAGAAYPPMEVLSMEKRYQKGIAVALVVASVYFFVVQAARYNLAVMAASAEEDAALVIVDAGHGGEDGGASTADGVLESQLNLAIALRLEQVLALCGCPVEMIRRTDTAVYSEGAESFSEKKTSDLKNRVAQVNAAPRAILISIHQNHFTQSQYAGAQVFYAASEGSRDLAEITQGALRQALDPDNNREIKPGDAIYLLEQIQCPGVLVECGFLSNAAEAKQLQTPTYQTKIACAVAGAAIRYLESEAENLEI